MSELPLRLQVVVPTDPLRGQGKQSTAAPYGQPVSFRASWDDIEMLDRARSIIDSTLSRSLFVRMAAANMAAAIIKAEAERKSALHVREQVTGSVDRRTE